MLACWDLLLDLFGFGNLSISVVYSGFVVLFGLDFEWVCWFWVVFWVGDLWYVVGCRASWALMVGLGYWFLVSLAGIAV